MKKTVSILVLLCMAVSFTLMLSGCVQYSSGVVVSSDFAENYTVKVTKETTTNAMGIESVSTVSYEARFTKEGVTKLTTELNGTETEILQATGKIEDYHEIDTDENGTFGYSRHFESLSAKDVYSDYVEVVKYHYDSEKQRYYDTIYSDAFIILEEGSGLGGTKLDKHAMSNGDTKYYDYDLKVNEDGMPETLSYSKTKVGIYGMGSYTETEKISCEFSEYGKTKLHESGDSTTSSDEPVSVRLMQIEKFENYTAVVEETRVGNSSESVDKTTFKMAKEKLEVSKEGSSSNLYLENSNSEEIESYEALLFPLLKGEFEAFIYDKKADSYKSTKPICKSGKLNEESVTWAFNNVVVKFTEFGELESFSADCTTARGANGMASVTQWQISVKFSDVGTTVVDG